MTLAAVVAPLAAYAVVFQNLVYISLPAGMRLRIAPLVTGSIGAALTLGAGIVFGFEQIGLIGGEAVTALVWGGAMLSMMILIGIAMLSRDDLRARLAGQPLASLGNAEAITQILVRIPVFTVLIEEAFFRGVLHAALVSLYPTEAAIWLGAGLFGLWHIGPALDQAPTGRGTISGRAWHAATTVMATTVVGAFLVWLRIETASIWAPVAVHAAINMTMATFVRLAARRSPVLAV